jgi:hypothetical protein
MGRDLQQSGAPKEKTALARRPNRMTAHLQRGRPAGYFGGETYQQGGKVGDRKLVEIRMRSVVLMSAAGEKEEVFLEDFTMNR